MFYKSKIKEIKSEIQHLENVSIAMQKNISRELTEIYKRINEIENYINEQVDEVVFEN